MARWQRLVGVVSILDFLVVLFGTALAAAGALVIEDRLPKDDEQQLWVPERLLLLAALVLLLLLALAGRQGWLRSWGTLYYVSFLSEWMQDPHVEEARRKLRGRRDARLIQRQLTRSADRRCALDVADDVGALAAELGSSMNDDDPATGFNLWPNLLYPMSIGLGYDVYAWEATKLEEAPFGGPKERRLSWELTPGAAVDPSDARWDRPLVWLEDGSATYQLAGGVTAIKVLVRLTGRPVIDDVPWPAVRTVHVAGRRGWQSTYAQACGPAGEGLAELGARLGAVTVHQSPWRRGFRVAGGPLDTTMHPIDVTDRVVEAIRGCLHDYPESPLLVAMRVPKTVGLAIGWKLSNPKPANPRYPAGGPCAEQHESCKHPWRRIIPIYFDQDRLTGDDNKKSTPTIARVHRAQPCLHILTERAIHGRINDAAEESHRALCDCAREWQ
ncbi:MAG: hypothetical protein ACRCYU_04250 [Nocardioides sp.]